MYPFFITEYNVEELKEMVVLRETLEKKRKEEKRKERKRKISMLLEEKEQAIKEKEKLIKMLNDEEEKEVIVVEKEVVGEKEWFTWLLVCLW